MRTHERVRALVRAGDRCAGVPTRRGTIDGERAALHASSLSGESGLNLTRTFTVGDAC
jgi:hypothetical protein